MVCFCFFAFSSNTENICLALLQDKVKYVADEDFEESDLSDIEDFEEEEKENELDDTDILKSFGKKAKVEIEYEMEEEPRKRLKTA